MFPIPEIPVLNIIIDYFRGGVYCKMNLVITRFIVKVNALNTQEHKNNDQKRNEYSFHNKYASEISVQELT
jgi:hypothetical protein